MFIFLTQNLIFKCETIYDRTSSCKSMEESRVMAIAKSTRHELESRAMTTTNVLYFRFYSISTSYTSR
ncbi:hypothetical protein L6452_03827 [Arctium lappa]|uniref:Uncharacterized protein n=1 Tax=Arctium lappa TaxID=4217 RepID=A0ACB9FN85_ARCLA|nr:hypothetical protein L6452_03827 [Arctium lappa]